MKIDVIVYTDGISKKIFQEVLERIEIAKSKVRHECNVFISLDSETFVQLELDSYTNTFFLTRDFENNENAHLKIASRIQTCLNWSLADYVILVEHDVLIHEHYINDVINSITDLEHDIYTNKNYIQLCKDGFQKVAEHQNPLHQLVMKRTYALNWFAEKVKEATKQGWCYLEPHYPKLIDYPEIITFGRNVHINHKTNFTNHKDVCYGEPKLKNIGNWNIDLINKLEL